MQNTKEFRTKSLYTAVRNPEPDSHWPIAIDVGYSSVKGYSPNSVFVFPAYAKNRGKNPSWYGEPGPDTIIFRDGATGEQWLVGAEAQRSIEANDTNDSQLELFGRKRYYSPMFRVLLLTAIGMGMIPNGEGAYDGSKPIFIQTGLPTAYLDDDREVFTDLIAEKAAFAIKTGYTNGFINFEIDIERRNINVMSQPQGTLVGLSYDDNANVVPGSSKYSRSNVLMFDGGFGTLDVFDIKNGQINSEQTFSDLGMREVLQVLSGKIKKAYGLTIQPSSLQKNLETGKVTIVKRKGIDMTTQSADITELLDEASNEVCRKAIERILNSYQLEEYKYLIITGGTGSAWNEMIRSHLDIGDLEIVSGNASSPETDMIFSNVRGYYMGRADCLRRKK